MPNDVKLQSQNGTHPLDENLRPLKIGDKTTPLELSNTDVKVNNLIVGGTSTGVVATDETKLPLAGGTMTGDITFGSGDGIVSTSFILNDSSNIELNADSGSVIIKDDTSKTISFTNAGSTSAFSVFNPVDENDFFSVYVANHGATTMLTADSAASAAHMDIGVDGNFEVDAVGDITLDAEGGNITLLDGGSTYTPTATSDATTKTYVDSQTVVTATAYNNRVHTTTWMLANNDTFQSLTGTDTTVGDTQDLGTLSNFDMRCLMFIVPFNMTVHTVAGSVMDDDMDDTVEKRMGIWRLPALAVAGADPGSTYPDILTLAYITDAFGSDIALGLSRVCAFYDTSADFALTAGDGIFMAYLNPQSAGNDDVALTMSIWAHQTTP